MTSEGFDEQDLQPKIPLGFLANDWQRPRPKLLPTPTDVRGIRIHLELLRTEPPVWRRIEVPGDIQLPRLHDVIQGAMGWQDSHLHRFRTGDHLDAPEFLTQFDLEEGDQGTAEDGVRLDQIVAAEGDLLWYQYDFGDSWDHVLRVEAVLDSLPPRPICTGGELACPPEDCGGTSGYSELAKWVRNGSAEAQLPNRFESKEYAMLWLPEGWHPDVFNIDKANETIAALVGDPIPVTGGLAGLLKRSQLTGSRALRIALSRPAMQGSTEISDEAAAALVEPFQALINVLVDGAELTSAGNLKPADVREVAVRARITEWWISRGNREAQTPPVTDLRELARSLGLVSVRKGRIATTQAARRVKDDPQALLKFIAGRLPLGKEDWEQQSGWMALVVAGLETPMEQWDVEIGSLMYGLGWESSEPGELLPPAESATYDVLRWLASARDTPWRKLAGVNPALAAMARAAIQP